jgi:hypothetical protein
MNWSTVCRPQEELQLHYTLQVTITSRHNGGNSHCLLWLGAKMAPETAFHRLPSDYP